MVLFFFTAHSPKNLIDFWEDREISPLEKKCHNNPRKLCIISKNIQEIAPPGDLLTYTLINLPDFMNSVPFQKDVRMQKCSLQGPNETAVPCCHCKLSPSQSVQLVALQWRVVQFLALVLPKETFSLSDGNLFSNTFPVT